MDSLHYMTTLFPEVDAKEFENLRRPDFHDILGNPGNPGTNQGPPIPEISIIGSDFDLKYRQVRKTLKLASSREVGKAEKEEKAMKYWYDR